MQIIVLFKRIQEEIEKHHQHSRFKKNIKSKDMQMKHAVQQKSSP